MVGLPPQAAHLGKGRFGPGIGALAFQRADQRGFLAADVAAGAAVHLQVQVVAGTEDVPAKVTPVVTGGDRLAQQPRRLVVLRADKDIGHIRLDGIGGADHALEQLVRVTLQQQAVLEGARLHLVGIADQVLVAR